MTGYRVHEMVTAFPKHRDAERASTKASIAAIGVQNPAVIWTDAKGKEWLIDGVGRQEIVHELIDGGVLVSANGTKIELPVRSFTGTESDALEFIKGQNLHRRDMDTNQRAASAIISGAMARKYKQKETGQKQEDKDLEGDPAEDLAKEYGTNRTYLFDCQKIGKTSEEILRMVLDGGINIQDAKKACKRIKEGKDAFGTDEASPETTAPAAPPVVVVYDGLKQPVGEEFVNVFSTREEVRLMVKELNKVKASAEAFADGAGGATCEKKEVLSGITAIVRNLKNSQPHVVCPYCSGTGKDPENSRKKCANCKGATYLDKIQFGQIPEEIRAKIPGAAEHGSAE